MKKQVLIIFYFLALVVHFAAAEAGNQLLQYLSKPLLMPLLALFFIINTTKDRASLKKWILPALFFSWLGDVLLMFQENISDFFLFGLSAFLIAHIFYILFFHSIRVKEGIKGKFLLLIPVAIYYGVLMIILSPYLGDMAMPVRIYGVVISFMFVLALHMLWIRNKPAAKELVIGALFFIASDSVLAFNQFYSPFAMAGAIIMITYGLAQFLLVRGAILYINGIKK